ncbi:MAG: transposase [Rhodoferax sp.]|nr:transposase [Rhodoferax sp.]
MIKLALTLLELIDRIAALIPPPRTHRHRYFGLLAPNSPLRCAVTATGRTSADRATSAGERTQLKSRRQLKLSRKARCSNPRASAVPP